MNPWSTPSTPPPLFSPHFPAQVVKKRRERKASRPLTPPTPQPTPPPNLRHRASLRCPPRLTQGENSDSDSDSGSSQLRTSRRKRQNRDGDRRGVAAGKSGAGPGGGKSSNVITPNGVQGGKSVRRRQQQSRLPERGSAGTSVGQSKPGGPGGGSVGMERGACGDLSAEVPWCHGRGYKRLHDDSAFAEKGVAARVPQRPRVQEAPRSAIPADAVIVEV